MCQLSDQWMGTWSVHWTVGELKSDNVYCWVTAVCVMGEVHSGGLNSDNGHLGELQKIYMGNLVELQRNVGNFPVIMGSLGELGLWVSLFL